MSITTVKAFVATCDACGANFEDGSQDFTVVHMTLDEMKEALADYEWLVKGKKCYCPDCKPLNP